VDFPRIIARLKELNYRGAVTIEREISGPQQMEDVRERRLISKTDWIGLAANGICQRGNDGGSMSNKMKQGASNSSSDTVDRRKFIGTAAMTAGMMFLKPELVRGTAANSAVRVGLLGCGGRGTEDATNLVDTGGARVVTLGDLFQDQLDKARDTFNKMQQAKGYSALDESQLFVGRTRSRRWRLQRKWTPSSLPHHLIFIRSIWRQQSPRANTSIWKNQWPLMCRSLEGNRNRAKRAEGKLSLDVGFQIRDCPPFVEMVKRIHAGRWVKLFVVNRNYFASYLDRPAWPDGHARGAPPSQLGVRPRSLRRHHRGTEHSRHRHLQLGVEGASIESFGERGRTARPTTETSTPPDNGTDVVVAIDVSVGGTRCAPAARRSFQWMRLHTNCKCR